ncbi:MAG TPA: DsbA family protein [Thermoleophilaceae bacterium]|nr:DsbA family protein [Thermoleophilaceae bacterium]
MPVRVRYYTDPACPSSWAAEPALRKLMVEFGADLSFTYVMSGLARQYEGDPSRHVGTWLDEAERSGMPVDPRLWLEAPPASSYPACMAVKAAQEQGAEAAERYLRALREGLFCFRRKLDTTEALVEEARSAGLDAKRFRIDLDSHAIVEAFGADLELWRSLPGDSLPALQLGDEEPVLGPPRYEQWRTVAEAAGARRLDEGLPGPLEALDRFGRLATAEIQAVCDLPRPRAEAELWRLATEFKVKPEAVLTGTMWTPA